MNKPTEIRPIHAFSTEEKYVEMRRNLNALVEKGDLVNLGRVKIHSPDLCIDYKIVSTGEEWRLTAPDKAARGSFLKTTGIS